MGLFFTFLIDPSPPLPLTTGASEPGVIPLQLIKTWSEGKPM